jgi:hypothetical protein
VTDWSAVFLGVIAVSVLVMATLQVGVVVFGLRAARQVSQALGRLEQQTQPVLAHLQAIGADAARTSALAAAQMERADRLFAELTQRIDETTAIVQEAVIVPAREGAAVLAGLRAAVAAIRDLRSPGPARRSGRFDEEDPLFIG